MILDHVEVIQREWLQVMPVVFSHGGIYTTSFDIYLFGNTCLYGWFNNRKLYWTYKVDKFDTTIKHSFCYN